MGILTKNSPTEIIYGSKASLALTGDIGGGTFVLQRLKSGGDEQNDSDWVTIQDGSNAASYTTVPTGNTFDLSGPVKMRGKLTGATSPALEYLLRANNGS